MSWELYSILHYGHEMFLQSINIKITVPSCLGGSWGAPLCVCVYIIKSSKRVAVKANKTQLMSRAQIWGGQMACVVAVISYIVAARPHYTYSCKRKVSLSLYTLNI